MVSAVICQYLCFVLCRNTSTRHSVRLLWMARGKSWHRMAMSKNGLRLFGSLKASVFAGQGVTSELHPLNLMQQVTMVINIITCHYVFSVSVSCIHVITLFTAISIDCIWCCVVARFLTSIVFLVVCISWGGIVMQWVGHQTCNA